MSRKRKQRDNEDADVPISAMIDVVFLLIIFFVVTASMDREIQDENVHLTNAPHGKPVKKKDPRSVTINIRADGTCTISGSKADMHTIENVLKNAANEFGVDIPIIIRADKAVLHGHIKKVMEAITATRLYRVKFQALKDDK